MAPTLLVVGGGFAGIYVAKAAKAAGYEVVVVDKKNFFDVKFASLRSAIKPEVAAKHVFSYSQIPNIGTFKQASVTSINKDSAQLDNGETIKFDYAVIATGSSNRAGVYAQPQGTDLKGRIAELQETAVGIKNAKSILIIGAGSLGVELAAEIVEAYAGKTVTLVNAGAKLFENRPAKVGDACAKWLKEHGVEVIHSEKATATNDATKVVLKSGKQVQADLIIWTVGAKPNTEFLKSTELASALDEAGRVKVEPTLQVVGFPSIFALGDINDVKEEKLGYFAKLQAELTGRNFAALLKKGKDTKLTAWVPSNGKPAMFLTLGSGAGVGVLGTCVFPSFMVAYVKSKDLFVGQTRKELGIK